MMLKKKKRSVAIVLFILLLCISVFPVFAREEDPGTEMLEIETEMTEVSMEVVNQAYDEAKIKIDSDISWVMMEQVNYRLSALMSYLSGMSTEEFNSVLEGFSEETLVSVDDLIEQTDAFISDSGVDGEGGIDLSGYGNAAASWKKIQESINGTIQQDEGDGDQEVYEQLSPESKMDYLEAALEVDNAVWDVLRSVLENRLDGLTELAKAIDIDLKGEAEKGVRVISGIIDLVNEVKLKIDVGFDEERYENRIRISNINSSYSLLEQTLYAVCTAVSYGDKVLE